MVSDRTVVTELATAIGMLGRIDIDVLMRERPQSLKLDEPTWDLVERLWHERRYQSEFAAAMENGSAFLAANDGLAGRLPRSIEWTGGRKAPGDEVVPADLRVDHVYLVSCKYLSRILHNLSPARLVEAALSREKTVVSADWYQRVAPEEHQSLYEHCVREQNDLIAFDHWQSLRRSEELKV